MIERPSSLVLFLEIFDFSVGLLINPLGILSATTLRPSSTIRNNSKTFRIESNHLCSSGFHSNIGTCCRRILNRTCCRRILNRTRFNDCESGPLLLCSKFLYLRIFNKNCLPDFRRSRLDGFLDLLYTSPQHPYLSSFNTTTFNYHSTEQQYYIVFSIHVKRVNT